MIFFWPPRLVSSDAITRETISGNPYQSPGVLQSAAAHEVYDYKSEALLNVTWALPESRLTRIPPTLLWNSPTHLRLRVRSAEYRSLLLRSEAHRTTPSSRLTLPSIDVVGMPAPVGAAKTPQGGQTLLKAASVLQKAIGMQTARQTAVQRLRSAFRSRYQKQIIRREKSGVVPMCLPSGLPVTKSECHVPKLSTELSPA